MMKQTQGCKPTGGRLGPTGGLSGPHGGLSGPKNCLKMNLNSTFGEKDGIVGVPCITCVYEGEAKTGGFLHEESDFRAPDHSETRVLNI